MSVARGVFPAQSSYMAQNHRSVARAIRRFLARRKWCGRTDTNECWCRGDQSNGVRTIPITPEMRHRAVTNMLSRHRKVVRITEGQR